MDRLIKLFSNVDEKRQLLLNLGEMI